MKQLALLILIFVGCLSSLAISADWNGCADELERLRNSSRDAFDAANKVKSMEMDLVTCKKYPDIYDLARDGCLGMSNSYRDLIGHLEGELKIVDSRVRSISNFCGMSLSSLSLGASVSASVGTSTSATSRKPNSVKNLCDLYRGDKEILPLKSLMKVCEQSMSKAECHKCLDP